MRESEGSSQDLHGDNSSYMIYLWTMISEMDCCKESSCGVACKKVDHPSASGIQTPTLANADTCHFRRDEAAFLGVHQQEILPSWVSILYLENVHVDSVAAL